jgi:hypothetical protein
MKTHYLKKRIIANQEIPKILKNPSPFGPLGPSGNNPLLSL